MGIPNNPNTKQQATLAFKSSKDSTKFKEEEDDDDDVQPAKKRKISSAGREEDSDGDLPMKDEPETADAATVTNGKFTPDKATETLFVSDDEDGATMVKSEGTFLTKHAKNSAAIVLHRS